MSRRSESSRTCFHRANYLLLCGNCHSLHFDSMPLLRQLALKKMRDPVNWSLSEWLKLSGRAGVTEADVDRITKDLKLAELHPRHYPMF